MYLSQLNVSSTPVVPHPSIPHPYYLKQSTMIQCSICIRAL